MTPLIDGRAMMPPEPLEAALETLASMSDDDELVMLLNCQPQPLYDILRREAYTWREQRQADGSYEIRIRKAQAASVGFNPDASTAS